MAKKNVVAPRKSAESTVPILDQSTVPILDTTTLFRIRVKPNGSAIYSIPGVNGTMRIAKGMLTGEAPVALTVNSGAFKQPDPERAAKIAARGVRVAKAQASLEERVVKAQAQLAKAADRAAKAEARAAKLVAKLAKAPKAETPEITHA